MIVTVSLSVRKRSGYPHLVQLFSCMSVITVREFDLLFLTSAGGRCFLTAALSIIHTTHPLMLFTTPLTRVTKATKIMASHLWSLLPTAWCEGKFCVYSPPLLVLTQTLADSCDPSAVGTYLTARFVVRPSRSRVLCWSQRCHSIRYDTIRYM